MSGLSTSLFFGLIPGQGCAIVMTAVPIAKSWKGHDALSKLVAVIIAYFVWLGITYASFVTFGDRIPANVDREALVLAWPVTAVMGGALFSGLWLVLSKMKTSKNA